MVARWQLLFFLNVGYIWAVVSFVRFPAMCYPWQEGAVRDAAGRLLATTFADEGVLCGTPQVCWVVGVGVCACLCVCIPPYKLTMGG